MNGTKLNKIDERKLKEIEHSDRRRAIVTGYEYFTDSSQESKKRDFVSEDNEYQYYFSNMKFYSITRSSFAYRDRLLYHNIINKKSLDYCCGNGEIAIEMGKKGADVTGIDISQVAVNNANKIAEKESINKKCVFKVMDAEHTEFEDNSFDIIHEYGALHHLDLDAAFKELARILKPDGRLICTEALRHNPLISAYRKRTPHLRTEWEAEHILGVPEIMSGKKYFKCVNLKFFHLVALFAVPIRSTLFFEPILSIFEKVDDVLLRIPYVQKMAWIAVVQYSNPEK